MVIFLNIHKTLLQLRAHWFCLVYLSVVYLSITIIFERWDRHIITTDKTLSTETYQYLETFTPTQWSPDHRVSQKLWRLSIMFISYFYIPVANTCSSHISLSAPIKVWNVFAIFFFLALADSLSSAHKSSLTLKGQLFPQVSCSGPLDNRQKKAAFTTTCFTKFDENYL